jgi:beta-1,2-mannobiose phosphorylase / 1,2-beta-oligomannan phosphorylase
MIPRLFSNCLLRPSDLRPTQENLDVEGVFNPGAVATENGVVLLVRVAENAKEKRPGWISLPRRDWAKNTTRIEWIREEEVVPRDQRLVYRKDNGAARLTFVSHLRVVHSRDGRNIDSISDVKMEGANEYEEFGVEDPRITQIGDTYWITYVGVSRHGVATALASTKDFKTFQRHGIIFPPENKDIVLFPEKIGGEYWAFHRPNPRAWFAKPEMWTATSPDLLQWKGHEFFYGGTEGWEVGRVGAGTPPMRRPEGWVQIFHGNSRHQGDPSIGTYYGAAMLSDAENPRRILGRSQAILGPESEHERRGFVADVVFPTGWVDKGETVLVYYGAADSATAVVEFSWRDIMKSLR